MQSGKKYGMQTLNDALYQLYMSREVTDEECLRVSGDPNEFLRMIGRTAIEDAGEHKSNGAKDGRTPAVAGRR
jgi:twitching motility protein PilT